MWIQIRPMFFDKRVDIGRNMSNMNILLMLILYIAVVAAIIISHIFISHFMKNYENDLKRKKNFWLGIFSECKNGGTYLLKKDLIKKLKDSAMLAAFSDAYNEVLENNPDIKRTLSDNRVQIAKLGSKLGSHTMRAFFAYMIAGFDLREPEEYQCFDDLMLNYLSCNSVYVRENALRALYSFGNEKSIAEAFVSLSKNNIYHSEKLLGDDLLKFIGNKVKLAEELMNVFTKLSNCFKIAVINFLRYTGNHNYDAEFRSLLDSSDTSTDIMCCIIRLLSKFYSIQNGEAILKVLENNYNSENWNPAAVAASSLVPYDFGNVIQALVRALNSNAWYVRINSAKSLAAMKVSDEYISMVVSGNDRYAIEALKSELSKKKAGAAL